MAHEGALKNPGKFCQNNYKAFFGQIHWWLKRMWARLAGITAVESRYAGSRLRRFMPGAFRQREEETAAPYFGGFEGA
jgi:hypothetical protein